MIRNSDWNFVENKGQVDASDIKYYGHQGGVYLYCQPGKISFVFNKTEKAPEQISEATGTTEGESALSPFGGGRGRNSERERQITTSRASLILLNSNLYVQILASDQQEYYENYYTSGNADSGITNVHTFKTITYKDIYPHIDLILHSQKEGMKYEFMVHPGGKVSDIQIRWEGIDEIKKLKDSKIEYSMAFGETDKSRFFGMEESKPVSFQEGNEIKSDFVNEGNLIGFKLSKYDKSKDLLIDPTLDWATYYGGSGYDFGNSVITNSGNVYVTGYTTSHNRIASSGAYQTSISGTCGFLSKFSSSGSEIWATYFGGGADESKGLSIDGSGNIFITGVTSSSSGISTSGAYQTSYIGGWPSYRGNAFLAKFSDSGKRVWGTYFGGDGGGELGNGVQTDNAGNVYITGSTASDYNIATSGAYQTNFGGTSASSTGDAFIAKFTNDGALIWATYFGGPGDDQANGIAIDGSNSVYITGITQSKSGIATNGAYSTVNAGNYDMFLAKFDSSGAIGWATYYGGTGSDYSEGISVDRSSDIYIAGFTQSNTGIATSGAFLTKHFSSANTNDGCLIKFDSTGSLKWGTYFGNSGNEAINHVSNDDSGNIYITGLANNNSGITTTNAYMVSCYISGSFMAEFNGNCKRIYGTYCGSGGGYGISVDQFDNVYVTGSTASSSGIATPGAFQTVFGGGYGDAFLARFKFHANADAGIVSILKPNIVCPGKYPVKVTLKNFGRNEIKDVEIHWAINFISQKIKYWSGDLKPDSTTLVFLDSFNFKPGTDTIQAWTEYPNGVLDSITDNDSTTVIDTIYKIPAAIVGTKTNECYGLPMTLGAPPVKGNQYSWHSVPAGFSSTLSFPQITSNQLSTITYILKETNPNGCNTTDSVKITVHSLPAVNPGITATICSGKGYTLGAAPDSGSTYYWKSNPAQYTYSVSDPVVYPTLNTIYYVTETNIYGCSKSDSVMVIVNPVPIADAGNNSTVCLGGGAHLGTLMYVGDSYNWKSNPAGFSSQYPELWVYPDTDTRYILSVSNKFGCIITDSVLVTVNKLPLAITGYDTTICDGKTDSLGTKFTSGDWYYWYSTDFAFLSDTSQIIVKPDHNTMYYLLETNSFGCKKLDSVLVKVLPSPASISAGVSESICFGTTISIGSPAIASCSYNWSSIPPGFASSISDTAFAPMNTRTYFLTETAQNGCSKMDSVTITVHPMPVAIVGSDTRMCEGSSIKIGSAKIPGYQYQWTSLPLGFSSTLSDPDVSPSKNTMFKLKVTTEFGCADKDSLTVTVSPSPVPDVGSNQTICAGTSANIGGPPVSGNSYDWVSFPSGFSSSAADTVVKPDTTTSYILFESGSSGCTRRAYITITVNPYPNARWLMHNICDTVSFLPLDSNNRHYSWNFGDGDSDITDITPMHIYKSIGYEHVSLLTSDSLGCTAKYDSVINIDCVNPQYQDSAFELQFYPNPFHESATLHYLLNSTMRVSIVLYDALGKQMSVIEDKTLDKGVYTNDINSITLHMAHGVYFLVFRSDNRNKTLKIVAL